jgi:hypothetical protein
MLLTMFDATLAAFWSAVAASFSAFAAISAILIQRRNLLESVRPELVLTDWGRAPRGEGRASHEVVTVRAIKNVGRGAALHVHCNVLSGADGATRAHMTTLRLPILGPGEEAIVESEIVLWWSNTKKISGPKMIPIKLQVLSWDSRNFRHETTYTLFAFELGAQHLLANTVAPGLMLGTRRTRSKPVWLLKFTGLLARLRMPGKSLRNS